MVNKSAKHAYPRKQLLTALGKSKSHIVTHHNLQWLSTVKFHQICYLKTVYMSGKTMLIQGTMSIHDKQSLAFVKGV